MATGTTGGSSTGVVVHCTHRVGSPFVPLKRGAHGEPLVALWTVFFLFQVSEVGGTVD